jgi:DNA-binding response OmpR family regulator
MRLIFRHPPGSSLAREGELHTMTKGTVLFADNDADFLATRSEFLRQEGYHVIPASDLETARWLLEKGGVDLAVLDGRLVDDNDEKDTSGLELAKASPYRDIPKIILTDFPTYDTVREVLRLDSDGRPIVLDYVIKEDGPLAMLEAVKRALLVSEENLIAQSQHTQRRIDSLHARESERRLAPISFDVSWQLNKDYEEVRREAVRIHWTWLSFIVIGAVIFLGGVVAAIAGYASIAIVGTASGMITEALGLLFTKFATDANRRRDQYHKELKMFYEKQLGADRK